MDWFAIFRPGKWTGNTPNGPKPREFTEQDMARIKEATANGADPDIPIVTGHPKDDSPKWGEVPRDALKIEDGVLWAKASRLHDDFKRWVKDRLYDRVSIALRPDNTIKHIGFLGGTPPAVKGLPQVSFSEDFIEYEFSEGDSMDTNEVAESLFQKFMAHFKTNTKPQEDEVPELKDNAEVQRLSEKLEALEQKFSEADENLKTVTKERDELKGELSKVEQAEADRKQKAIHEENVKFAEDVAGTKIPTDQKDALVAILDSVDTGSITFSEGEGEDRPASEGIKGLIKALPDRVTFGEIATKNGQVDASDDKKVDQIIEKYMEENNATRLEATLAVAQKYNLS